MRERPIVFSGPMIRGILSGAKTQTRFVMKLCEFQPCSASGDGWDWDFRDRRGRWNSYTTKQLVESKRNPHGAPGDRLWCREAFTHITGNGIRVHYRADGEPTDADGRILPTEAGLPRWRSPIFMSRRESRITLEITDVRVQRLQEISEDDARAEGVEPYTPPHGHISPEQRVPGSGFNRCRLGDQPHRLPFADLWDSINGKRYPWSSNPWIWALTLRRLGP